MTEYDPNATRLDFYEVGRLTLMIFRLFFLYIDGSRESTTSDPILKQAAVTEIDLAPLFVSGSEQAAAAIEDPS